ncbi:expressed unknown protein [Seminavis robusta]|uniref:Uncharacterized protein n=1 Tax=Seminavis robusta TaxID=568900 RepID=A0A9N8HH49_9STRA|nr:expressed unknown protein [Seminavis robusta]|eukprot:Sro431_g353701.1  (113) ;mRNA; r:5266-5604
MWETTAKSSLSIDSKHRQGMKQQGKDALYAIQYRSCSCCGAAAGQKEIELQDFRLAKVIVVAQHDVLPYRTTNSTWMVNAFLFLSVIGTVQYRWWTESSHFYYEPVCLHTGS